MILTLSGLITDRLKHSEKLLNTFSDTKVCDFESVFYEVRRKEGVKTDSLSFFMDGCASQWDRGNWLVQLIFFNLDVQVTVLWEGSKIVSTGQGKFYVIRSDVHIRMILWTVTEAKENFLGKYVEWIEMEEQARAIGNASIKNYTS